MEEVGCDAATFFFRSGSIVDSSENENYRWVSASIHKQTLNLLGITLGAFLLNKSTLIAITIMAMS